MRDSLADRSHEITHVINAVTKSNAASFAHLTAKLLDSLFIAGDGETQNKGTGGRGEGGKR